MKVQISVIIPVLNENHIINQTIMHLDSLNRNAIAEIIVVDGNPLGSTINGISKGSVKKITAPSGRGVQMNTGAISAQGDHLLFLHADVRLPIDAFEKIAATLVQKHVAAGAFSLGISSPRKAFRIIERGVAFRGRLTQIPYGDQAIFMNKKLFFQLGGFKEILLLEDVELMRRIKKKGGKIIILPAKVQASARRWEKEGILYCTLRNHTLILLYLLGVSPARLAKLYRSGAPPSGCGFRPLHK